MRRDGGRGRHAPAPAPRARRKAIARSLASDVARGFAIIAGRSSTPSPAGGAHAPDARRVTVFPAVYDERVVRRTVGSRVLTTKLHPPAEAPDWVARPRLVDALESGADKPLTLVSAPAGYGKSVLVAQWAARHPDRVAWIALDEWDSDLEAFTAYLVAAVRRVAPHSLTATEGLLGGQQVAPVEDVVSSLSNDLDALEVPLTIVLEDYHLVDAAEVDELLGALLLHAPAEVAFVIVTRYDPALPLALLRGHGHVNEIREGGLRFAPPEASALLEGALGAPVPDTTAALLVDATEGWAAGLRLSAVARRDAPAALHEVPAARPMDSQAALDYLASEVLDRQPAWVRRYLLATSAVSWFDATLADQLVEGFGDDTGGGGGAFIDFLSRRTLFTVRSAAREEWFRYHQLFGDLLLRRLRHEHGEESVDAIRRRAVASLETRERVAEAIELASKMGAADTLAEIIGRRGSELVEREEWRRLEAWLALLPRATVEASPDLLMLEAWVVGELLENPVEMRDRLTRAEALIASAGPEVTVTPATRASIETLRGLLAFIEGDAHEALGRAHRANTNMPSYLRRHLTFTVVLESAAHQATGDLRASVARALATMTDQRFVDTPFEPWTWTLPYVFWLDADIGEVQRWGEVLESRGRELALPDTEATGRYFQGVAAYEHDDLDAAEQFLEVSRQRRYQVRPIVYVESEIVRGLAHLARGRVEGAERIAHELTQFTRRAANPRLILLADSFSAEVELAGGATAAAMRWAERASIGPPRQEWYRHAPATSLVRTLLAAESDSALSRAEDVLTGRLSLAERMHNRPRLAQGSALLARVHQARGRDDAARAALERAVKVTEPGRAVRLVADAGPHLSGLLSRLDATGGQLDHVARTIAALREQHGEHTSAQSPAGVGAARYVPGGDDGLTERETEVLVLLDRRLSNKEIARELIVSPATVKKYTISIYRKLHVSGRRDAADKARALGYLQDD